MPERFVTTFPAPIGTVGTNGSNADAYNPAYNTMSAK
jgi:hypothetical protein